ncbi:hypothetical protein J1N35_026980 [Gossypium stocksii]|uniref:Uncharacterized protein n=1 Tax=Gossypium stocksii TaxID=47602 RepID=A0A9D3V917_9ROSI|nr:hypothetical protein J1N35_026980 [Gossypium stocksii]
MAPVIALSGGAGHGPRAVTIGKRGWWSTRGTLALLGGRGGLVVFGDPRWRVSSLTVPPMACPYGFEMGTFHVPSHNTGHGVGPYSRPLGGDPSADQHNGPNANLVGFQATYPISVQNLGVP